MNLTDDAILKFQKGSPILFYDICAIYSVTLGEIVDLGYSTFQLYLGAITASKPLVNNDDKELKQLLDKMSDFEYIIMTASADLETCQVLKQAFQFFTHENVIFSLDPAQIIIGPIEEKHIITEEKFYELQRVIRRAYFLEQDGEEIIIYPDDDQATVRIKMRMRANREKVRKAKAKQAAREKSDLNFSDLIGSLTINNCGLNMDNIWNITYYAFHDQLKRMGWRDQYDTNTKAALAGAKMKKNQLKHWIRSIASSDKT